MLSQKGLAQVFAIGGSKEPKVLGVKITILERSLDDVILGAMSTAEARGMSIADESLLEEAFRYSFFEPCSLSSFEVRFLLLLSLREIRR